MAKSSYLEPHEKRCTGQFVGVTAACKQRRTCARYLSFMYDKPVHPRSFNASAAIRNCKDKIEVFNEH